MIDLEEALFEVVVTSTEPTLGAIRLAWWREALERLDHAAPPAEPRLQAAASELLTKGVSGASLAAIEDGVATLLDEQPNVARLRISGAAFFNCAACLLREQDERLGDAGGIYFSARAARLGLIEPSTDALSGLLGQRFSRPLRPLTALAKLAARDIRQWPEGEAEATPARAVALLSHRMFGAIA